jgi:hypothetical protein
MGRHGDMEPVLDVRQNGRRRRTLGRVGPRRRRRQRRLEVAPESNYPIVGGMTPTAGGVVFFGDIGGQLLALVQGKY